MIAPALSSVVHSSRNVPIDAVDGGSVERFQRRRWRSTMLSLPRCRAAGRGRRQPAPKGPPHSVGDFVARTEPEKVGRVGKDLAEVGPRRTLTMRQ